MRELIYTVLELEEWCISDAKCDFCSSFKNKNQKVVCQIRTRNKMTEKIVTNDVACENCKEKFLNDELPKCERCGKLQTTSDIDIHTGKHVCRCIRRKESIEEKELPVLPDERRPGAFYERQINALQEKEKELTEEVDTHLEALEIAEDWHKRQKQELLDKIKELETEIEKLKKQTPQALVDEIESHKKEIESLKGRLEQFQQAAQMEVPAKVNNNKIRSLFKFGSK